MGLVLRFPNGEICVARSVGQRTEIAFENTAGPQYPIPFSENGKCENAPFSGGHHLHRLNSTGAKLRQGLEAF